MPKYSCHVKMEVLCWIPDIEAENEEEAKCIARGGVWEFFETVQSDHINDDVVEIENYDPLGDVEIHKQEEEKE